MLIPTEAYYLLRLRSLFESVLNAACAAMLVSKHAEEEVNNGSGGHGDGQIGDRQERQWDDDDDDGDEEVQRWTPCLNCTGGT